MTDEQRKRQRVIEELIRGGRIANQEELSSKLASIGFAVNQATVSRDLEQLGAMKVRRSGRSFYALPEPMGRSGPDLGTVVRDWVVSIEDAGNLVVIKTPPGSAQTVGVALDQADLPDIVGTICGDDTIFAALESPAQAKQLAVRLRLLGTGQSS